MPQHLASHSIGTIRRAILDGLKTRVLNGENFSFSDLSYAIAVVLFPSQPQAYSDSWKNAINKKASKTDHDVKKILTVCWNLVTEGVFYPEVLHVHNSSTPYSDFVFCLTQRGLELVQLSAGHPFHPNFVGRLRSVAPSIRDDVLAAIEDATQCLSHGLLRASVVMLGVAAETTLNLALDGLLATGKVQKAPKRPKAQEVIELLKTAAPGLPNDNEKHDFEMALVGLDGLRRERNKAAHPHPAMLECEQVEALIVAVARCIQDIWRISIQSSVNDGYKLPPE